MKHFTYIIFSKTFNIYYKGYSTDPQNRLTQHNQNEFRFTTDKGPWELVYFKEFETIFHYLSGYISFVKKLHLFT